MNRELKFRAWDKLTNTMVGDGFHLFGEVMMFGLIETYVIEHPVDHSCNSGLEYELWRYENIEVMQFTGLLDKNGKEVFEGDILRWFTIDIEYQTHYGDNIPNGSYTEPCGTICKIFQMPVIFRDGMFTCQPMCDVDEDEAVSIDCPIQYPRPYDRKELNHIFWPRPYGRENEVLSDGDFAEVAESIAEELGIVCASNDDFIQKINGFEVIGNIYQNAGLLTEQK